MAKTTIDDFSKNPGKFVDNTVVITANKEVHYGRDPADAYNSAERSGSEIVAQDHNIVNSDSVFYLIRDSKGE